MIQTGITQRARETAALFFGDQTDSTGHPHMQALDAIAEQMDNEFTAAIVYYQDMPRDVVFRNAPLRVFCAVERLKQRPEEATEDFVERIIDDSLTYPVAYATSVYFSDVEHYIRSDSEAAFDLVCYEERCALLCRLKEEKDSGQSD